MNLNGILAVDKPPGMTSHDVVARLRRASRERRIGHTGTLDPTATGVLVLCFGKATRLIPFLDESDKVYLAHLILGVVTDTQDFTGRELKRLPETQVTREDLLKVFAAFTGEIRQTPPMYSAVKQGGRPLYELARQGLEVERAARSVIIHEIVPAQPLAGLYGAGEGPWLRVRCSKGTYIRTLCHDMGERLGCGGHLRELVREASGTFTLKDAVPLELAADLAERGELAAKLVPPIRAVAHLATMELSEAEAVAVRQGRFLTGREVAQEATLAAGVWQGVLVAILKTNKPGEWRPVRVF